MRAQCDACGTTLDVLHIPLRVHGWFCGLHCPRCNPPGAAPTVPHAPTTIPSGKFAGSLNGGLSDSDLKEAHRATSREDGPTQQAIAAERRRRWRAGHSVGRFSKRQRARYAMRWGVAVV